LIWFLSIKKKYDISIAYKYIIHVRLSSKYITKGKQHYMLEDEITHKKRIKKIIHQFVNRFVVFVLVLSTLVFQLLPNQNHHHRKWHWPSKKMNEVFVDSIRWLFLYFFSQNTELIGIGCIIIKFNHCSTWTWCWRSWCCFR
jgi:putative flippase GtrA